MALWQLREAKTQRVRQFETAYIERYWSLMDRLSVESYVAIVNGARDVAPSREDLQPAYAYLLLSEDEAELRKAGWISDATWILWREYIHRQLQQPPFSSAWESAKPTRPGEVYAFEHVRRLELAHSAGQRYDPCELGRIRRYLRGLR